MNIAESASIKGKANSPDLLLTRRAWLRRGIMFFMLGIAALFASEYANADSWWLHGVWCDVGMVLTLPILARVYRADISVVLRDHRVMFSIAFAVYFLFGASILAYGTEEQIMLSTLNYHVDAVDSLRADAVNAIGFGLALIASAMSKGAWLGDRADRLSKVVSKFSVFGAMAVLMVFGTAASFNALLVDFAITQENVSGIWRTASQFVLVSILLGSSYRGRHEAALRWFAVVIAIAEMFCGALLFNKSAMLLPLGALIGGLCMRYGTRRVLPIGILSIIVLYGSIGGAVSYGRSALDSTTPHSIAVRWNVFKEGLAEANADSNSTRYSAWARLCYVSSQTAAYDFYNGGTGGDDFRVIPWLFIPRALAPGKPETTQTSVDFNEKITGNKKSSTGMGIFASGYYNGGWIGLVMVSIICGWLIAQTSAIASAIMGRDALLLLPFALGGFFMAFRIDGHFLADYFGFFVYVLYPIAIGGSMAGMRKQYS